MRKLRWSFLWMPMLGFSLSACSASREFLHMAKSLEEPVRGKLYGAIWNDLKLESFINGGSWVDLLRGTDDRKELTVNVRDIGCSSSKRRQLCAFDLVRVADVQPASDNNVPEALRCTARFIYTDEGWKVDRLAPRKGGGHTRTTMQCNEI